MNSVADSINLAVVAIGRNEGQRLKVCLEFALAQSEVALVVYVDSGSTDGSAAYARSCGCLVVNLDMSIPFTAARGRNEGFALATEHQPQLTHVQFVDGDCELAAGWLPEALRFLIAHPAAVAVCGRRRERNPQNSIYNQLCDIEWNTPVGLAKSCGGDVLMRAEALRAADGYRAGLIAGEEPELCVRLRAAGGQIYRIDYEMTLHDANILRFSQWWSRSKRAGYAFAEGVALHGAPPERHWVRESRSAWVWGAGIPGFALSAAVFFSPWAFAVLLVYPLQVLRIYLRMRRTVPAAAASAFFMVLGKLPEAMGQVQFWFNRFWGRRATLIEYK